MLYYSLILSPLLFSLDFDDGTKSEYSLSSQNSNVSFFSQSSNRSKSSNSSGMSTVSVLSHLTNMSSQNYDSRLLNQSSSDRLGSFVIEGLDHTLLSRGKASSKGINNATGSTIGLGSMLGDDNDCTVHGDGLSDKQKRNHKKRNELKTKRQPKGSHLTILLYK